MMTEKQNKLWSICASLGLHGLAVAVLIFGLSGNTMIPRDLGKLDFLWVSFAARDKASFLPAGVERVQKAISTANRPSAKPEMPATRNIRAASEAAAPMSEEAASDKTMASTGHETVAYAAAGGHHAVSDAGRQTAATGVFPAFSNAYPLYKENPPPGYPEIARQQGYEGLVLVSAEILADGRVGRAVVSKSSGYAILDQSAIKAVRAWKFEPAKKSGIPYKTWAELPIKFVISDYNSQS